MNRPGIIDRAFQVARSGSCTTLDDIRQQLSREAYMQVSEQISGPALLKQLREAITSARREG